MSGIPFPGKNVSVGHYTRTVQPICFILAMLMGEDFRPEWDISTIYHCKDTPFWLETLVGTVVF